MPTNFSGRITLILAVLLAALWAIFPSFNLRKPDLKPGIDMAGGTSLLYEIKAPAEGGFQGNLAEQVMESLKKRVDPEGVRNLIWRPQGATRLEIQMPLTAASTENAAKRQAYTEAQKALEATNIRVSQVLQAVEKLSGDARANRLNELAMGSDTRAKLFGALRSTYDAIKAAEAAGDARQQAIKETEYETLKAKIDATNIGVSELQSVLETGVQTREKKLAELRTQYADFPKRLEAINNFADAYQQYAAIKGSLDDANDLKRLLRGSGVLEFHILATDWNTPEARAMVERLNPGGRGPAVQAGDEMRWFQVDRAEEFKGQSKMYNDKHWALAYITPEKSMDNRPGKTKWALEDAYPETNEFGTHVVGFRFNLAGANLFAALTGSNIGRPLAIMLDDKIISAPNINSQISRSGIITGDFSAADLKYLINTLDAGSLPAQLTDEPISERTVGPQLGEDNLKRGLRACIFGLVVVAIFLIGYYYIAGVVATIAVLINMVMILGAMAAFNATFTLPGIAGIVLTIGMAVDANVLIFERLREEQLRGLSLRMALRNAYDRAFSAILDSNVTTGITALVLYWFGSEEVRGFGLTLLMGLVSSLFTALFVTKTIFGLMIDKMGLTRLSSLPLTFPKWDQLLRPNIDWMSKAWIFYVFSLAFIITGCGAFGYRWHKGEILDIEFRSGTAVQFELKQPMPIDEVRSLIEAAGKHDLQALPSPIVQSVGTGDRVYEVSTPSVDAPKVKAALLGAMRDRLKLELPSTFAGVGQPVDQAVVSNHIVPISGETLAVAGINVPQATVHVGGAAIVLDNLDPAISPREIKTRIERQRLQPQPGQATMPYRPFDVVAEGAEDAPARKAVILISDPNFPYDKDQAKWRDDLAGPMWNLVNESVNKPADLQKVTNFDAQVAGEAQRDALLAGFLSVLVIMAYIWIRFGNLKYGSATVVALLHDTLFTLAAVGFSHMLANTAFGDALLIEPFRLNLTLVAAILTVMGYSMNDTVVVFDRIRENRGKFGAVSRNIVNDSINQTLSRTLLTGGTTIVTIFVMYIWGGSGIHGFTFALLVGILVGTYSSIAIASPILLIGASREPETKRPAVGAAQRVGTQS